MLFIVNPCAGSGGAEQKFNVVSKQLDGQGIDYTVEYTLGKGDATSIAKKAIENGEKLIVAVGGDGTIREVASALVFSDAVLGILPFGTGNDLSKALGISTDIDNALANVLSGNIRKMDACRANGQYFFNIAGIGFDVDVLVETERYKSKHRNGMVPYFLGILSALLHKKPLYMRVVLDDITYEGKYLLISIANGTHFGGGMKVAPNASPFDGMFDIVLIKYVNLWRFLNLLPGFLKGAHIKNKKIVSVMRAKHVIIAPLSGEYPVQVDGDIDEVTPIDFELLKGAINVVSPEVTS